MSASWTNLASLRMIIVLVPILKVKIGPYVDRSPSTYSKNGLPDRATWKRFPTIGHPGGPGGRLSFFDLVLCVRKKIKAERKKARIVKKRWWYEESEAEDKNKDKFESIFGT
jgi:hypothetical protein